jgi:hypothetical protein
MHIVSHILIVMKFSGGLKEEGNKERKQESFMTVEQTSGRV